MLTPRCNIPGNEDKRLIGRHNNRLVVDDSPLDSKCVSIFSLAIVFGEFDVATQTRWVRGNTEACANVAWPPKMPTLVTLFRHGRQLPSELPPKEEGIVLSTKSVRPSVFNHITTRSSQVTSTRLNGADYWSSQNKPPRTKRR